MQTDAYRLWSTRIVTFTLAAFAAASGVYWGFKGWGPHAPSTVPTVLLAQASPVGPQAVARALGGGLATAPVASGGPPAISRYVLVGVVAGHSRAGAALISVDGQEAKPVRLGQLVEDGMRLQSVARRSAVLSSGNGTSARLTLELSPLDK